MFKSRKTQITMFVILGLVLLIVFVILLALVKQAKPKTASIEQIINELETGRIKNQIISCMEEVATEGVEKIGANGGFIYDFEGGTIPFKSKISGQDYLNYSLNYANYSNSYFVAYGLRENVNCNKINYSAPGYPYPDMLLSNLSTIYNTNCIYNSFYSAFDGFFGQVTLSKLCYIARASGCEGFAKGVELGLTMQKQLESYTAARLPYCINFSAFTSQMLVNIEPEANPVVEVTIHDSDILLKLNYPLKISFENQEPIVKMMNYQTTLNVRLGRAYNFLFNLLSIDAEEIDFNLTNEFIRSSYWRKGLEVRKINSPCASCHIPYKYDNIIEVIDRNSLVKGKPLVLRAAVQNRRPALDKINDQEFDLAAGSVNISVKAYDPDDSTINYTFLSFGPPDSVGWRVNDPDLKNNLQNGVLDFPISRFDIGDHEVGIVATDEHGLYDYQRFFINIIDSSTSSSPTQTCIDNCILNVCSGPNAGGDCIDYCNNPSCSSTACTFSSFSLNAFGCDDWCYIAANACNTDCGSEFVGSPCFTPALGYTQACWDCVYPIFHASDPRAHDDCSAIPDASNCIGKMPDCFWVKENISSDFPGRCYDDTLLNLPAQPAYIILN